MKSDRKKRILAAILCMVMVLSGHISALAEGEVYADPDAVTQMETPEAVSETQPESAPQEPAAEEPPVSTEPAAPETPAGNNEPAAPETPSGNNEPAAPETPVENNEPATPETPEAPEEEDPVFSEETELTKELRDASGKLVQKVTAKLPKGAFEAETSQIEMEVTYVDSSMENYIKGMMEKKLPTDNTLGDYFLYNIQFKVNGEAKESLEPITITFEKSNLEIKDTKKANVFFFDPANPEVSGDKDELVEITQRSELLESLQAAGQSTATMEEDYDLSSIEIKEENRSGKIVLEGRKSTIYGCYVEKEPERKEETPEEQPEEKPADIPVLNYEDDKVTVSVTAEEAGIIPEGAELKVLPITSEDTKTKEQYQEVGKKIQEKVAEEEKEVAGFLAYDITFVDKDGNEMEPNGKVKVSMNYKKAELPQGVEEKKATDAEVTVLHLEEDENGEVKQVVDMAAEQKATVDTLATTEGTKVQNVEVETESFSVFTITWMYSWRGSFSIKAHYVYIDEAGSVREIPDKDILNKPSDFKFENENEILDITKEPYRLTIDGYSYVRTTVDKADGVPIKQLKTERFKEVSYLNYIDIHSATTRWLTNSSGIENAKTTGDMYFVYVKAGKVAIKDNIIQDGSLESIYTPVESEVIKEYKWYSCTEKNGSYIEVKRRVYDSGKENITRDGTKLYPAYDKEKNVRKWYKVEIVLSDGTHVESEPYQIPYYDQIQNGGFENVTEIDGRKTNEWYKAKGGVWQSTNSGTENEETIPVGIEVITTTNEGNKVAFNWGRKNIGTWWQPRWEELEWDDAEKGAGTTRFAEINCSAAGALYQDVLTIQGEPLNYYFSHRARGVNREETEYDEMYLVIVPTSLAVEKELTTQKQLADFLKKNGVNYVENNQVVTEEWNKNTNAEAEEEKKNLDGIYIKRVVSDDQNWHSIQGLGSYTPTSSLTRFFFMSGRTASGSNTIGNFVDQIGFGQELPPVKPDEFTLQIQKKIKGLGNEDIEKLKESIKFQISAEKGGKELSRSEVEKLFGVSEISGQVMKSSLDGTELTYNIANRPIDGTYEVTIKEEGEELDKYSLESESQVTLNGVEGNSERDTSATFELSGESTAVVNFTNTYESQNIKSVNFTKVWDDKENNFGTRPENLEVTLHGSVSYVDETTGNTVTKELTAEELGVEVTKTLDETGKWKTSWKVPVYYEVPHSNGTAAKIKIRYTVTEGNINSDYVYEAGEIQSGTGEDYKKDDFKDVTITGDGKAETKPATTLRSAKSQNLMTLSGENANELGEPNHRKYITYNEATGDYTLNLDVTGKKGEAKGVDVLFVIDTSGSMSDYNLLGNVKTLLTKEDGVVDKILGGKNNVNSVAYVSFAGKSETKTSSWYGANGSGAFKSQINNLRATGGTNWTYAMMKASEKLAERANNSNEKVMIFLSDGEPTYSINSEGKQYGRGNSTRDAYYNEAITKVTGSSSLSSAQKYSVYLTGVTKDGMTRFANGTDAELVDGIQLQTALEGILNKIIPTYENVSITDTLTEYVEFSEETNPTVTVYKDNTVLNQSAYTLSISGKKVRVSFNDYLEDGSTYRISFRVKTSQAANEYYSKNGGYPNIGDAGTGTTSAGEKGFYSNTEATLTYSVKGTNDKNLTATYKKPVVQITTHSLTFEKKWNKPENATVPTSVTLNVAYTDGTNEEITLTANDNWTVTKDNIPVTKKIQSVTEKALNDYTPSYEISADGTKATVTNSYSKITTKNMTVKKTWSGDGPESAVTVSLYQRKNDGSAEKIYKSEVLNKENDWTCTWEDLPSQDWQGGNNFFYAVREEKIPENYTSNITYTTTGDTTTVTINNVYDTNCADENYYIANKLQTIPLTVTKTWNDGNNVQGERPESLGVTVTEGDHKLKFTLSERNNWTKNVKVPKRNDGNYTATEDLTGITNYLQTDSSVNATDNAIYVSFTNQIQTTFITVNKIWVDGTPENRPGSIEFVLKRDGEVYDYYTLSAEDKDENGNSWTKVIEGLPVTGTYTIEEVGYGSETAYDYNSKVNGFEITNTLNWHIIKTSESLAGEATVNLEGAEFELKKDNKVIATGESDSNGVVQWNGSPDLTSLNGDYQLIETKAPNGYVLHEQGWTLHFTNGLLESVTDLKDSVTVNATYDAVNGARVTVTNTKLYELPETGGTGIFVYTIGGTLLLMAAALLIYKMKREEVLKG